MGFQTETALYKKLLPSWLPEKEGKWAVIKGEELLGVFDDNGEAWMAGYFRFGGASFLLREITLREPLRHARYVPSGKIDGKPFLMEKVGHTTYRNALTGEPLSD